MQKKLLLSLILIPISCGIAAADTSTIVKAERFYKQHEWASAAAMYYLLIDGNPENAGYYGRAIVSDGMRGDTAAQMRTMRLALDHHLTFDTLFSHVETESMQLGEADVYERFLLLLKEREPWMTRAVDARLMSYYAFRRNPEASVRYAETMLSGMPDDENALYILAQGYLGEGDLTEAMKVYKRIISINPRSYTALLYLGNAAADAGEKSKALEYLNKAKEIKPTPYVTALIERLSYTE